jgi:hypothetical protein
MLLDYQTMELELKGKRDPDRLNAAAAEIAASVRSN